MNQQPDKFFRDKLQSFQTPAPSGAWNRIEANLDKKKDKVLWFRIAASLLLVAVAAYLLWPTNSINTPKPDLAGSTRKQETVKPEVKKNEKAVQETLPQQNSVAEKESIPPKTVLKKKKIQQPAPVERNEHFNDEKSVAVLNEPLTQQNIEEKKENILTPVVEKTEAVAAAPSQKMKFTFSAEEVDNKYLDKKALADATTADKKPSTFKKLLDKAYDLKYNQDPFGDLRQKKDEILALNFRKDKRNDNK
jgi:hypothetical protein